MDEVKKIKLKRELMPTFSIDEGYPALWLKCFYTACEIDGRVDKLYERDKVPGRLTSGEVIGLANKLFDLYGGYVDG